MNALKVPVIWIPDHPMPFARIELSVLRDDGSFEWRNTIAMLDTGFFLSAIELALLTSMGIQPSGTTRASSHLGDSDEETFKMAARFAALPTQAVSMDAMKIGHPLGVAGVEAILGMNVLDTGRLVLDKRTDSFFEFYPA
ncbi:hypothetical protein [Aliihoeflea sp. PC F10.4]